MNPEAKAAWLNEMRTSTIPQGRNYLARHVDGRLECCALGYACEAASKAGVDIDVKIGVGGIVSYDGAVAELPESVRDWLGIEDEFPWVEYVDADGHEDFMSITDLNDSGAPRDVIADLIEDQL
jgi:hypothetical protein